MLAEIGRWSLNFTNQIGAYTSLVLDTLNHFWRRPFEVKELMKQLEMIGLLSFPVVAVTSLFTGMVFTLQTFDGFQRFQAEGFVPGVLGIALFRELVPVLGGMMVAGRVGSSVAAELGAMKVSDQIVALEVMGVDPIRFLVVPRFLAAILMMPLLITLGDLIGLGGGWFLINVILDVPTPAFLERVFEFLDAADYWSGIVKATCFGGIIATVGCYYGLSTKGGAEGVGRSTTLAVVNASLGRSS